MVINYITFDVWWDTDISILKDISNKYNVNVFIISGIENAKFNEKQQITNCTFFRFCPKFKTRNLRSFKENYNYYKKIRPFIKGKDSINIFIPWGNPLLLLLMLLTLPRNRTILFIHNFKEHLDNIYSRVFNILKRGGYHIFHFFLFFSEEQERLFKLNYPQKKTYLLEMPLKDFGKPKKKRCTNAVTFLFFGRIRDYKRLDLFIQAANAVKSDNVLFIIAGKASDVEVQKYYAQINDKSKFECYWGHVKDEDVADYFNKSDFLVLPYDEVTQSGPSLIALNYNIPIIASNLPGFRKLVEDKDNGFLFEKGNINQLIDIFNYCAVLTSSDIENIKSKQKSFREKYNNMIGSIENIITSIITKTNEN